MAGGRRLTLAYRSTCHISFTILLKPRLLNQTSYRGQLPSLFEFSTILLDKSRRQSVGLVRYSNKMTFEAESLHRIDARVRL